MGRILTIDSKISLELVSGNYKKNYS